MRTRESTTTLWVVRVVASRGLARETGLWILSCVCKEVFLTAYHSPFPGVKPFHAFWKSFEGCPQEGVSLCRVLRCMRGGVRGVRL